ncbi:hypothetical protein BDZ97DRAFT_1289819 [Flammula alnicola]|nr:hypothetical protein BDZ97DRAFT_1289819 [Flammula alnicola]
MDVLLVQDTTSSQGPYIDSAKSAIQSICQKTSQSTNIAADNIRFGLIAFRDHPPHVTTYVTKDFGFSSNMRVMQRNLRSLKASGGGDGPEAVTAELAKVLTMKWEENAAKMVVLITDAPVLERKMTGLMSRQFWYNDPFDVTRQMAERGMTLFVVAREPTLSSNMLCIREKAPDARLTASLKRTHHSLSCTYHSLNFTHHSLACTHHSLTLTYTHALTPHCQKHVPQA